MMPAVIAEWLACEEEVVEIYRKTGSLDAARAPFGLGTVQARGILRRHNVEAAKAKGRPVLVPPEVQAIFVAQHDAGISYHKAAKGSGWSEGAVRRACERRDRALAAEAAVAEAAAAEGV